MYIKLRLGIVAGLLLVIGGLTWLFIYHNSKGTNFAVDTSASADKGISAERLNSLSGRIDPVQFDGKNPEKSSDIMQPVARDQFLTFMSLLNKGSGKDIPGLVQLYEGLPEGPEKYAALFGLAKYWAETDPDGAMQYAISMKVKERDKEKLFEDIYGQVARADPDGFVFRILNEINPELRVEKSEAAIQLLGGSDPALVISVIEAEERAREKEDLLKMWIKDVSRNHPDSILQYVGDFTDFSTRQEAAALAMVEVSKSDPELAGFHYSRLLHDTESKVSVLPSIIKGYYKISDGNTQPIGQWMNANLLTSQEYDVAAATIVELLIRDNPDAAFQWLDSIEDENIYNNTVQDIEKRYSKKIKPSDTDP